MKTMKTILLVLIFITVSGLQAQTTYDLNWERNFTSPQADLTIDVGDTVRWTWTDALPHTVENDAGSTETFNSGVLSGLGQTYSYTFTQEGTNPYFCGIHGAASMSGVITVQNGLSVDEFEHAELYMTPNPIRSGDLKLLLPNHLTEGSVSFFDLLGKQVLQVKVKDVKHEVTIDITPLNPGMYLVKYEFGAVLATKRLIVKP